MSNAILLIGKRLKNLLLLKSLIASVLMSFCSSILYYRYMMVDFNALYKTMMPLMFLMLLSLFAVFTFFNFYKHRCSKCHKTWCFILSIQYNQINKFFYKKFLWIPLYIKQTAYIREYLCYECKNLKCSRGNSYSIITKKEYEASR